MSSYFDTRQVLYPALPSEVAERVAAGEHTALDTILIEEAVTKAYKDFEESAETYGEKISAARGSDFGSALNAAVDLVCDVSPETRVIINATTPDPNGKAQDIAGAAGNYPEDPRDGQPALVLDMIAHTVALADVLEDMDEVKSHLVSAARELVDKFGVEGEDEDDA